MTSGPRQVRDRDAVLLVGLLVVGVLLLNLVSGVLPGMDALLASAPVLIVGLVLVSGVVLLVTLRRSALTPVAGVAACGCPMRRSVPASSRWMLSRWAIHTMTTAPPVNSNHAASSQPSATNATHTSAPSRCRAVSPATRTG